MQRFILVDHSITGLAGHHYEYAVHVLRAAEQAGYDPVLVTNRRFREKDLPWQVLPLFEFGFWPEPLSSRFWKFAFRAAAALNKRWTAARIRLRYSELGLAWASRDEWGRYLQRRAGEGAPLTMRAAAVSAIALFQAGRLLLAAMVLPPVLLIAVVVWSAYAVARFCFRVAMCVARGERPVIRQPVRAFLWGLIAAARDRFHISSLVRSRLAEVRARARSGKPAQARQRVAFGRDAGRMLRLLNTKPSDLIFFPTLSEDDLWGLAEQADSSRDTAGSFHFLFRRNLYTGTRSEYRAQDRFLENSRAAFERLQRSVLSGRAYFYTDTDELTEQYDRLGIVPFRTLPVPHTYDLGDRIAHDGPLRLTYLGDARTEKGFPLLPGIAAKLQRDYLATEKARFVLQCNYNIPGGEPKAVIALNELETMPPRYIEFHREPLTSEEYRRLLLSSDLNLLCYDPANYYARSSGILVESLAAGIPVIVPSGCWLSRQFLGRYMEYADELAGSMEVLGSRSAKEVRWCGEGRLRVAPEKERLFKLPHDAEISAALDVPAGTSHMLIRGQFGRNNQSAAVSVREIGWDEEPAREARRFCIEGAGLAKRAALCTELPADIAKIAIGLRAIGSSLTWFDTLEIVFLRAPSGRRFPAGAVGLIYHSSAEIPALIKDMIDHYAHYRRTAAEFSGKWRAYHNSDRLLRDLEVTAGLTIPAVQPVRIYAKSVAI